MNYNLDAKNKRFGRLVSEISLILQGKKSANYEPRLVGSDRVMLSNYKDVTISGKKEKQKIYYRHTGYVGHLKEARFEEAFGKDPKKVIRKAVLGMLPKNSLAKRRIKNLVFVD